MRGPLTLRGWLWASAYIAGLGFLLSAVSGVFHWSLP